MGTGLVLGFAWALFAGKSKTPVNNTEIIQLDNAHTERLAEIAADAEKSKNDAIASQNSYGFLATQAIAQNQTAQNARQFDSFDLANKLDYALNAQKDNNAFTLATQQSALNYRLQTNIVDSNREVNMLDLNNQLQLGTLIANNDYQLGLKNIDAQVRISDNNTAVRNYEIYQSGVLASHEDYLAGLHLLDSFNQTNMAGQVAITQSNNDAKQYKGLGASRILNGTSNVLNGAANLVGSFYGGGLTG